MLHSPFVTISWAFCLHSCMEYCVFGQNIKINMKYMKNPAFTRTTSINCTSFHLISSCGLGLSLLIWGSEAPV